MSLTSCPPTLIQLTSQKTRVPDVSAGEDQIHQVYYFGALGLWRYVILFLDCLLEGLIDGQS